MRVYVEPRACNVSYRSSATHHYVRLGPVVVRWRRGFDPLVRGKIRSKERP